MENHHIKQTLLTYLQTYQPESLEQENTKAYLEQWMREIESAIQERLDDLMNQDKPPSLALGLMQAEGEILREMLPVPEPEPDN